MSATYHNKKFMDRKLPERSFLDFEYSSENEVVHTIRLPFFENITLNERRDSQLVEHKPLGRASSLFSWTGGGARRIKLRFMFTLPLLLEQAVTEAKYMNLVQEKEARKASFFDPGEISNRWKGAAKVEHEFKNALAEGNSGLEHVSRFLRSNRHLNGEDVRSIHSNYGKPIGGEGSIASLFNTITNVLDSAGTLMGKGSGAIGTLGGGILGGIHRLLGGTIAESAPTVETLTRNQIINVLLWWINVIRSSVLNNTESPADGPPIVRLSHGIMYRQVPCVVTNYGIDYDESAGLDLKTLLPRRITVSMDLAEVRAGDFTDFQPGHPIKRDNVCGWEVLFKLDGASLDPQPVEDRSWRGLGGTDSLMHPTNIERMA